METQLILVEGCPGSGKSSTAQFLCRQLQRAGQECRWYHEEERPHPVAATRGLSHARGRSQRAKVKPTRIAKLIHRMAELCAPLQPALFYFHQPDYAAAMRHILDERGPGIEELYIRRTEASTYGKRRGLQGFDGLVQGWINTRNVMEELFTELDLPKLSIDNTAGDWGSYYRQIGEFLTLPIELHSAGSPESLREYTGTYTYQRSLAPRRSGGRTRFETQDVSRRIGGLPRLGPLHHHDAVEFTIQLEGEELVLQDYGWLWQTNRLIPLKRDSFDLRSWPFQFAFERDESGAVVGAQRKSETTRWNITGQRYQKLREETDAQS